MPAGDQRGVVIRPLVQFIAVGLIAVAIVALATSAAARRIGEREAISSAREATLVKAQALVEPVLTDAVVTGDAAAVAVVADVVKQQVLDDSVVRVKLWRRDGTILYSDAPEVMGQRYTLGRDEQETISDGLVYAEISDLNKPENRFEKRFGKLLEAYLPIRTPDGSRLLFEAYYRYDAVAAAGRDIWRSFAPVTIGALVALELFQIPLAWSLATRLRQRQRERERLLHRAVEASDIERRRVASDLHDGVVQDLVGVSFDLAGAAREKRMPARAADALASAAESVRSTITSLRSMLLDIYPPDLQEVGLIAALEDLATEASTPDRRVVVEGSVRHDEVGPDALRALYRSAREATRNIARHSQATEATLRIGQRGGRAWLEVRDNGVGFDASTAERRQGEGHFGLRGLRDLLDDMGGTLTIARPEDGGTRVYVEVPTK